MLPVMQMDFSHWMALESAMQGEQPKRPFSRATLRRIAGFARPHRRKLVAFLILSATSAVIMVATPVLAGWVVDAIIEGDDQSRVIGLAVVIAVPVGLPENVNALLIASIERT